MATPETSEHPIRHERELRALDAVAHILNAHARQREMLLDVLDVLHRELGMSRGTIMLVSPEGTSLVVEAAQSLASPERKEVRYRTGEGIMGRVLETGRAYVVPRIADEPQFRGRIHDRGASARRDHAFICTPIAVENAVVGTLSVDVPRAEALSLDADQRLLGIISSMVSYDVRARRVAAMQRRAIEEENLRLRSALGEQFRPENIVGNSHAMRAVYERIHYVADTDTTVLVRGASGTGKELVASAIHYASKRTAKRFVKVNCAALSEHLIESELFGHEKGAFTGALYKRVGRIEEAEGGTLFLDEIGDFSPSIQVKLLRVLQEREFERVGSNETQHADVRIIAATNCDLEGLVESRTFREDLYYRINVFPITLPPLAERRDDILLLADTFVKKYADKMARPVTRISTAAINMMLAYHWPGNVRELENCIEHAVLLSTDGVIHGQHLPPTLQTPRKDGSQRLGSLKAQVNALEKDMIIDAIKRHEGNMSAAARELDITPRMVRYKIKKLDIDLDILRRKSVRRRNDD